MNNRNRQQRSSQVLVFIFGAFVILFVLAIALGGGGGTGQEPGRKDPQLVHNRVIGALESNEMQSVYDELSPSMKNLFAEGDFVDSQKSSGIPANLEVKEIDPPTIQAGSPWNGEWADAKVQITRDGLVEEYIIRYHLENNAWWLYATLKVK